jgi:hypothetical protein
METLRLKGLNKEKSEDDHILGCDVVIYNLSEVCRCLGESNYTSLQGP